jgi:hypothetical protein
MSKAQNEIHDLNSFNWTLPKIDRSESPLETIEAENSKIKKILENPLLLKIGIPFFLLIILFSISFKNKTERINNLPSNNFIEVIVSPLAIAKGRRIPEDILQTLGIPSRDLSKTQKLQLFKASQSNAIKGSLIAKKDIPPFKPLFWTDLTLNQNSSKAASKIQIFYKGEK